jgi:hypothetical protein
VKKTLTLSLSALTLIAAVWTGFLAADHHWARAADVAQKFQVLDRASKEQQYQDLRREFIGYENARRVRPLSALELQRYEEVKDDLQRLRKELGK